MDNQKYTKPRIITLHEVGYPLFGFDDKFYDEYGFSAIDLNTPNFQKSPKMASISDISIIKIDEYIGCVKHRELKAKPKNKFMRIFKDIANIFGNLDFDVIED